MNKNDKNKKKIEPECPQITVYSEDFCTCVCNCKNIEGKIVQDCRGCNGWVQFFDWLFDKSPDKKPFFRTIK